jgi:hypothetical protein
MPARWLLLLLLPRYIEFPEIPRSLLVVHGPGVRTVRSWLHS